MEAFQTKELDEIPLKLFCRALDHGVHSDVHLREISIMVKNHNLVTKVGVDTCEISPSQICETSSHLIHIPEQLNSDLHTFAYNPAITNLVQKGSSQELQSIIVIDTRAQVIEHIGKRDSAKE